jgi:hypothetical protein
MPAKPPRVESVTPQPLKTLPPHSSGAIPPAVDPTNNPIQMNDFNLIWAWSGNPGAV